MIILPIESVVVTPDRQRKELSPQHIYNLANSIIDLGLLQPIGVRRQGDGSYELRYGECRMMAMADLAKLGQATYSGQTQLPLGHIAAIDLGALDETTAKETEFAENDVREQLSWQERDLALAELHRLRVGEAAAVGETHTMLDTAREIMPRRTEAAPTAAIGAISDALIRTQHLDDPDVAKAKTPKEAMKLIRSKLEYQELLRRGTELAAVQTSSRHKLLKGKAEHLCRQIPDFTIDVLITDPPYGIDAQDFGSQFSRSAEFDDSELNWEQLMTALAIESARICKSSAHAYVFCDIKNWEYLSIVFRRQGWDVWPWPLIWHKAGAHGALPRPEHGPRRMYECILYALLGDRPTLKVSSDVISIPSVKDSPHPHEKPVELYLDLLARSARPGDTILDPFCGTGAVFRAANKMQLTAWGIELNDAYFALAQQALEAS